MFDDAALYEQPFLLSTEWGHNRIYAPQAYPNVRCALTLPLIIAEATTVAQHFPICWRREKTGPRLVALINMLPPERRALAPMSSFYPLVGKAYPFVVPDEAMIERQTILVDRALADRPTDIGAPLILGSGRLSKASIIRAKMALQLGRLLPATERLSRDMDAAGLLEPWPLKFELGNDVSFEREDLLTVSPKALETSALFGLVRSHGVEAGVFLSLQRISLFRASNALAQAKRAIATGSAAERRAAIERGIGA